MTFYILCFAFAAVMFVQCGNVDETSGVSYSYSISEDISTGWHIVDLAAENESDPSQNIAIKISPECGNNMFSLVVGDNELIDAEQQLEKLFDKGRGNYILYPTPNRVRNAEYVFMGENLKMAFPGEKRSHWLHGLAKDDTAWRYDDPVVKSDGVYFRTYYDIDETNPRFPAFPFKSTLTVEYAVLHDRVRISYEVENRDEKPLGFGFGLHPYWKVIGSREESFIQVGLPRHMEATEDLLPTGETTSVDGTDYDLRTPKPVSDLRLDDVYVGATPDSEVGVNFKAIGIRIRQVATEDFTHVVVYTPDADFFCVENQTCSTDAHNLHAKGLIDESHLQILDPGKTTGGHVDFIIEH